MEEKQELSRYIIEYDYILMTVNYDEKEPEHRIEIHTLFEDALTAYRRIMKMENPLGQPSAKNIAAYRVVLTDELDLNRFLN